MDPELAKLLDKALTVLGVIIAAAGAIVAAFVGSRIARGSAVRAAEIAAENQRKLATDQALRQWRIESVRPLLDAIRRRAELYQLLATALVRNKGEEVDRLVGELAATPDWNVYAAPLARMASEEMRLALEQLFAAEDESHALLVRSLRQQKVVTDDDVGSVLQVGKRLALAMAAVHDAAEAHIFCRVQSPSTPAPSKSA